MRPSVVIQLLCWTIVPFVALGAPPDANRLTYLDEFCDPYYPSHATPKLTTPQWIGESDVEVHLPNLIERNRQPTDDCPLIRRCNDGHWRARG